MVAFAAAAPYLLDLVINVAAGNVPAALARWTWLAWPVFGLLALAAVLAELRRDRPAVDPTDADSATADTRLTAAAVELRAAVRLQWTDEAAVRGLNCRPIRLRWVATDREVVPAGRGERPRPRGDLGSLAGAWLASPTRQLVVLGEPGAGKTVLAVLLTLELLDRDDAVPVLLSVATWRPPEHLYAWAARRLAEEYPALVNSERYGPDAPARLLAAGAVVPVLDGLDELPTDLHAAAVEGIDLAIGADNPLVLTSRGHEYECAAVAGGLVPAGAEVVELATVDTADTADYLAAGRVEGDPRWSPVLRELRDNPDGVLAVALRTPLMAVLCRTAYAATTRCPADLLDRATFADPPAIERHLLDAFVPAKYADRPVPPTRQVRRRPVDAGRALRWLTFLARSQRRLSSYTVAWWQLHRVLPRVTTRVLTGAAVAAVSALVATAGVGIAATPAAGRAGALSMALLAGPAVGILVGLFVGVAVDPETPPARINARLRGRTREFARQPGAGLAWGAAAGLLVGAVAEVSYRLVLGTGGAVVYGPVLGPMLGLVWGLAFGLSRWLNMPADAVRATDPAAILRADRTAFMLRLVVFAVLFGATGGIAIGQTAELPLAVVDGVALALAGVVAGLSRGPGAWGTYTVARVTLASRGRLPWRLMSFLDDARHRGVLRQVGGVYQFRHARLQDRLAGGGGAAGGDGPVPPAEASVVSARWRPVLLAVVVLVAGAGLGVGLPVAAGFQTHCGRPLFETGARYLKSTVNGECYGVSVNGFTFGADDGDLTALQREIRQENARVEAGGHYITVVYVGGFTADTSSVRTSLRALAGIAAAQRMLNHGPTGGPQVRVLVASGGRAMGYGTGVARIVVAVAEEDRSVVGVVGLDPAGPGAIGAARVLDRAGLAVVSMSMSMSILHHPAGVGDGVAGPHRVRRPAALRRVGFRQRVIHGAGAPDPDRTR